MQCAAPLGAARLSRVVVGATVLRAGAGGGASAQRTPEDSLSGVTLSCADDLAALLLPSALDRALVGFEQRCLVLVLRRDKLSARCELRRFVTPELEAAPTVPVALVAESTADFGRLLHCFAGDELARTRWRLGLWRKYGIPTIDTMMMPRALAAAASFCYDDRALVQLLSRAGSSSVAAGLAALLQSHLQPPPPPTPRAALPPTPRSALERAVRRALADEAALELLRSGRKAAAALVEQHAQLVAALAPAAAVTADMATSLRELELSRERGLAQRGLVWGAPPVEEARLLKRALYC